MLLTVAVLALGIPTAELEPSPQPLYVAQDEPSSDPRRELDLKPRMIEDSPVLQRWLEETPDLDAEIRHDPTVRSRVRAGYSQPLSEDGTAEGWVGVEDIFIDDTSLAISGEYRTSLENSTDESYSGELRYYLRPLGSRVNLAPVVGYRSLETGEDNISGVNVGLRLVLALSRSGASDISVSQTWVNPGDGQELGLTTIGTGYAVTSHLRIGTELQIRSSSELTQHHLGVGLEWMF